VHKEIGFQIILLLKTLDLLKRDGHCGSIFGALTAREAYAVECETDRRRKLKDVGVLALFQHDVEVKILHEAV